MGKKILVFILIAIFLHDLLSAQVVCSYGNRRRITFDPTRVAGSSDLVNFPALIDIVTDPLLETTANGGEVTDANGDDIIFTAADGVTLLQFDREDYDATTGHYTAWVKIPVLSTTYNTHIYIYWGNSAVTTSQESANTWSGYHAVWHFQSSSFADATTNAYNATNNSTTNQAAAQINNGRACSGTQWMQVNGFPNMSANFSISGWAYTTNSGLAGQRIFCDDENNSGGYAMSIGDGGPGTLRFFSRGSSNVILDSPGTPIANNTWYHCVAVADITNGVKELYINGVQVSTQTFSGWGTDVGTATIAGEMTGTETANRINGRVDEVRLANTDLSAGWIATEYNNQSSPATFYSISGTPKVWDGSVGTSWGSGGNTANWTPTGNPAANADVIIAPVANQPVLALNPSQINSLWLMPTTTLNFSTRQVNISSDILNCGVIIGNTGLLVMNGTSVNVQNQTLSGSGTYNLNNLTINNTFSSSIGSSVTLNSPVLINGTGLLTLTSGILVTTSTNRLTLNTNATSGSGSSTSFVSGPIAKIGAAAFVFPIGKGTSWRRLGLTGISATSTFVAEYFNSGFTSSTPVTAPLTDVSVLEYWQLDRTSGGNANVQLYWESASASGINLCSDLTIARWTGATWTQHLATTVGATTTCNGSNAGSVLTNAVVTSFSPFTFGSRTGGSVNPLPIGLTSFTAGCEGSVINLGWTTATERNNDHFVIERSYDALEWQEIGQVKGAGTSILKHNYEFTDMAQKEGVYYRLTEVDNHDEPGQRWITEVNCEAATQMRVFPNPSAGAVSVEFTIPGHHAEGLLEIYDSMGRLCYTASLGMEGKQTIHPVPSLPGGAYVAVFHSKDVQFAAQKFVIVK